MDIEELAIEIRDMVLVEKRVFKLKGSTYVSFLREMRDLFQYEIEAVEESA